MKTNTGFSPVGSTRVYETLEEALEEARETGANWIGWFDGKKLHSIQDGSPYGDRVARREDGKRVMS
jgi:hypothetical protein